MLTGIQTLGIQTLIPCPFSPLGKRGVPKALSLLGRGWGEGKMLVMTRLGRGIEGEG